MKKRFFIAFIGVLAVAGILAGIKTLQINKMVDQAAGAHHRSDLLKRLVVNGQMHKLSGNASA